MQTKQLLRQDIIGLATGIDEISRLRHQLQLFLAEQHAAYPDLFIQIQQPAALLNLEGITELESSEFTTQDEIFKPLNDLIYRLQSIRSDALDILKKEQVSILLTRLIERYVIFRGRFSHYPLERQQLSAPPVCMYAAGLGEEFYYLPDSIGKEINPINKKQKSLNYVVQIGNHFYKVFRKNTDKKDMVDATYENAVYALSQALFSGVIAPTELVLITIPNAGTYCVSVSAGVKGDNLQNIILNDAQRITTIRASSISKHFLLANIVVFTDAKFDAYILDDDSNLIGVDNDRAFDCFIGKRMQDGVEVFYNNFLSCFLLLPQADQPLDVDVREKFLSLDARQLIEKWLNELVAKNNDYQQYVMYLEPEYVQHLHLPLRFLPRTIFEVYQRIINLQEFIKHNPAYTLKEIFRALHPMIADTYAFVENYTQKKTTQKNRWVELLIILNERHSFNTLEDQGFKTTGNIQPYVNYANIWMTGRAELLEYSYDAFIYSFLCQELEKANAASLDQIFEKAYNLIEFRLKRFDMMYKERKDLAEKICWDWFNRALKKLSITQAQKLSFYLRAGAIHLTHAFYEAALEHYTYVLVLTEVNPSDDLIAALSGIETKLVQAYCNESDVIKPASADYVSQWYTDFIKLRNMREKFRQSLKLDPIQFVTEQKKFTLNIKSFLADILVSIQTYLGRPPCAFSLLGIGSMARNALCPYSDLDCVLLVAHESARTHSYFRTLVKLFNLRLDLLGEAVRSELRTDSGDLGNMLPAEAGQAGDFINTPEGLLTLFDPASIDISSSKAHSLHRPTLIYAVNASGERLDEADEELLKKYKKNLLLKYQVLAKTLAPVCFVTYQKSFYQQMRVSENDALNKSEINIKDRYLTPLVLWCTTIALYQGIDLLDPMEILLELAARAIISNEQAQDAQTAMALVQHIRCGLHFEKGCQEEMLSIATKRSQLSRIDELVLQQFYAYVMPLFGFSLSQLHFNSAKKSKEYLFAKSLKQVWEQALLSFLTPDTPTMRQKCSQDYPHLPLVTLTHRPLHDEPQGEVVTSLLYPEQVVQLIDPKTGHFDPAKRNTETSQRLVIGVKRHPKDNEIKAYFKVYPEFPGIQVSVDSLTSMQTGYSAHTELVRFTVHLATGEISYPVMLSQPAGKTLQILATEDKGLNIIEDKLDPYFFALKVFATLIIHPEDDKIDNVAVQWFKNQAGKEVCRLLSFDNERAYVNPLSQGLWPVVELKSIVFCFKQMRFPLNRTAVEDFLTVTENPEAFLRSWLQDLDKLTTYYQGNVNFPGLFSAKEIERDFNRKGDYSFSPIVFEPGVITQLYQRLLRLRSALKNALKADSSIKTLFDILSCMEPLLANYYAEAFTNHQTPESRFDALKTNYKKITEPDSTIVRYQSVYDMKKCTYRSLTEPEKQKRNLAVAIATDQIFGPKEALEYLARYVKQYQEITNYRSAWLQGNFENLKLLKQDKKGLLIETVLRQIDFSQFIGDNNAQKELFILLPGIDFRELTIRNSALLTNGLLDAILAQAPNCRKLNLSGCTGLTSGIPSDVMNIIATRCPQIEYLDMSYTAITQVVSRVTRGRLKFTHLKRLRLNHCMQLTYLFLKTPQLQHLAANHCWRLTDLKFTKMALESATFDHSGMIMGRFLLKGETIKGLIDNSPDLADLYLNHLGISFEELLSYFSNPVSFWRIVNPQMLISDKKLNLADVAPQNAEEWLALETRLPKDLKEINLGMHLLTTWRCIDLLRHYPQLEKVEAVFLAKEIKPTQLLQDTKPSIAITMLGNDQIVCGYIDGVIKIWSLVQRNFEELNRPYYPDASHYKDTSRDNQFRVTALAVKEVKDKNHWLISGYKNGILNVWDLKDRKSMFYLDEFNRLAGSYSASSVTALLVVGDDKVVSHYLNKTFKFWDLKKRSCIRTFSGHLDAVIMIKSLPDNRMVSVHKNEINIWDLWQGKCVQTLQMMPLRPAYGAVLVDNFRLLTSSYGGINIWDLKQGEKLDFIRTRPCDENSMPISSLLMLANNRVALYYYFDNALQIIDLTTRNIKTLTVAEKGGNFLVSEDGYRIIGRSADRKRVDVWDWRAESLCPNNWHKLVNLTINQLTISWQSDTYIDLNDLCILLGCTQNPGENKLHSATVEDFKTLLQLLATRVPAPWQWINPHTECLTDTNWLEELAVIGGEDVLPPLHYFGQHNALIPKEIVRKAVTPYLNQQDRRAVQLVCKNWKRLFATPKLLENALNDNHNITVSSKQ